MEEFLRSPWSIAIFMGAISIGISIWKKKGDENADVWEHINKKVDKTDHEAFAKRIGKQVDVQDSEITKIGKSLAFLVGKMGGDYDKLVE